jgi:hypothetical protein
MGAGGSILLGRWRRRRDRPGRLTALALEAFEVASLEELHAKLEPFLAGPSRVGAPDASDAMGRNVTG